MSQFDPTKLASLGKQTIDASNNEVGSQYKSGKVKKLPQDTVITHHGEIIGKLSSIAEGVRCDCPEGHLHSDGRGEDYAHTVRLSGGEIGISCSGDSCSKLFVPDTPYSSGSIPKDETKLDIGQLDNNTLLKNKNSGDGKLDIGHLDRGSLLNFTEEMIPEPIRDWTVDNCRQTEGSLNYGAVSAIIAISNTIGMRCQVRPKQNDNNWLVTPNLWGMLIGNPSERKSPVAEQFLKPIKRLELKAAEAFRKAMLDFEPKQMEQSIAAKAKKKELEEAYKSGDAKMIERANAIFVPNYEEPKIERFIINDATTEKVGEIMSCSERTLLLHRDELSGFFNSLGKAGREGDRSFYLESFKGDAPYTYDRIGRGTIHIKRLSIGLFGTIQPSVLTKYITHKNGEVGDGLAQRMQLAVFSEGESYPYYDKVSDTTVRDNAYELIEKLAYENYELMPGATLSFDGVPYFGFDSEAQEVFKKWYGQMKQRERDEPNESMQAHLGKYYSLLPSLALVFFMIDKVAGETDARAIEVSHIQLAIRWCEVLETHARVMYALSDERQMHDLPGKIVEYVRSHPEILPASCGKISGNIRGAKADDVENALKGIAEFDGKQVLRLTV